MYKEILKSVSNDLNAASNYFKDDIASLRTGRVTPALVEDILVSCYGGKSVMKELAVIQVIDGRTISIQPWDKSILADIEKAIRTQRSGMSVVTKGEAVLCTAQSLSEEQRKDLVKTLNQKTEEARIKARIRRDSAIKQLQAIEGVREDDKFRFKDELQKIVDDYNKKIEDLSENKSKEIMTI